MAHPKQAEVRARYGMCCGYCGVSETDSGGELTVDHYRLVSADGDDSDENLVYACMRCNLYKADYFPDEQALAAGQYVLHPIQDVVAQHIHENIFTGELEPLTETGRFHIEVLHLNRPQLIAYRQRRGLQFLADDVRRSLVAEVEDTHIELAAYARYTEQLERLLGWRKT